MIHCNEHIQIKIYGLRGTLCDSLGHTTASKVRFFILLCLGGKGHSQGQRVEARGGEMSGMGMHGVKPTKNKYKVFFF